MNGAPPQLARTGALPRASAAADVHVPLWDRLALDLGATTTVGHVADADSWMFLGCGGPPTRAVLRRPFELDAVAAACVMREAYSRLGLTRANVAAAGKGSASGVVWVMPAVGVTLTADVTSIFAAAPIVVVTTEVAERAFVAEVVRRGRPELVAEWRAELELACAIAVTAYERVRGNGPSVVPEEEGR